MIILGVDPGTAITGYGVIATNRRETTSLVECGVIRTRPSTDLALRLEEIYRGLDEVLARHEPDLMAVEGIFYSKNVRTTVVLGHARGAILLAATLRGIPVAEYAPAEVKSAIVGTGRATKEQVQFMVQRLLRLREPPRPADAADGVAVALTHLYAGHISPSREMGRERSGRERTNFGLGTDGTGPVSGPGGEGREGEAPIGDSPFPSRFRRRGSLG